MKTLKHDIRVALLGNVSTGKTMTMNALFGNKHGEVSMKRTAAAVNYFKISTSPESSTSASSPGAPGGNAANVSPSKTEGVDESNGAATTGSWHAETDEPRSPASTLKEISEDNRKLRDDTSSAQVQEKWFDIELDEELCDMRNDTQLVIVDIPGINEAGACSKYKDYVNKKWHTFDCVVLVMDGKQGVNTEDQVLLLNLVKSNKERIKNVPVIILFNKVDDPEDQEQADLIREAFQEIEALFNNKKKDIRVPENSGVSIKAAGTSFGHAPGPTPFSVSAPGLIKFPLAPVPFRAAPSPFGAPPQSTFGGSPAPAPFGSPAPAPGGLFGQAPLGSAPGGTKMKLFQPTSQQDGTTSTTMQSISAMGAYEDKSFEELRYEDYVQGNKSFASWSVKAKDGMLPPSGTGPCCFLDFQVDGTPVGRVVVKLYQDKAPLACENFRSLCTGEKGKGQAGKNLCFQGCQMHRIVPNFCIQGGDFTKGDATGGESIYPPGSEHGDMWGKFKDETPFMTHSRKGLLSMANNGPNQNGSQFFITLKPLPNLDGKHVVFGEVVQGLDVVGELGKLATNAKQQPLKPVVIVECGQLGDDGNAMKSSKSELASNTSSQPFGVGLPTFGAFGASNASSSSKLPSPFATFSFGNSAPVPTGPSLFGMPAQSTGAQSSVAASSVPSAMPSSVPSPSPKFSFGGPAVPSTPSPFWQETHTQTQFTFGAAPSGVGTSTNRAFTFGSVTVPASPLATQPPGESTPQHQEKKRAEIVTPNGKEDISTKEDKEEALGGEIHHSKSSFNDGLDKADPTELHEEDPFKNLPPSVGFIPISSLHGFANRCASRMKFESFCSFFDKDLIEKVGRDQIGRLPWKKLSDEERTKAVYDMLSDPDDSRDVLHDSRFDKFMTKLKQFVGGEEVQTRLIEEQITVSLKTLLTTKPFQISFQAETGKTIAQHVQDAYTKMQSLQKHAIESNINIQADELKEAFWKAYNSVEKSCFQNVTKLGPGNCHVLSEPIDELVAFHAVAKEFGWSDAERNAVMRMKVLVHQMIRLFIEKANALDGGYSSWSIKSKNFDPWQRLSPLDWSTIWSSILLMSCDRQFCLAFGTQKMLMERELLDAQTSWHAIAKTRCCPVCLGDLPMKDQQVNCGGVVVFWAKCNACKVVFTKEKYKVQGACICICCRACKARPSSLTCSSCQSPRACPTCPKDWALLNYDIKRGQTKAAYPDYYKLVSCVRLVDSVENKNHFGHAAYRFCEFMNR